MSVFFGTDGLRGIVGKDLNFDIAFKCGNSLGQNVCEGGKVIIGRDTRTTGTYLVAGLSAGLMACGVDVVDVGIIPTGGIAFLTKELGFEYGIMVTASHNPSEYNGIKIFSKKGEKIDTDQEEKVERGFIFPTHTSSDKVGSFKQNPGLSKLYLSFLASTAFQKLNHFKIVLDCSNGASYKLAPALFKKLGATVIKTACRPDGRRINLFCGSLHPEILAEKVKKNNADFGLAFDGDADRLIAVNKDGKIIDGDLIMTALAKSLSKKGQLNKNIVVGTSLTNMGVETELGKYQIRLLRADVGDKYVALAMHSQNLSLGGEKSGHMIISKYMHTGDGLLTAVQLCCFLKESGQDLGSYCDILMYPQVIKSITVKEKIRLLGSEILTNAIASVQQELAGNGRVLVRASGTEPKIRIMVESLSKQKSMALADYLTDVILSIERTEK